MKRPILIVVIGYIIGIIWGQYLYISIVPLYIFITILYLLKLIVFNQKRKFKIFSFHRYFRYIQLFLNVPIILILCISSFISFIIVKNKKEERNKLQIKYQHQKSIMLEGKIISKGEDRDYKIVYEWKANLEETNIEDEKTKGINLEKRTIKNNKKAKFYININKKSKFNKEIEKLKYGQTIWIKGNFIKPETQRNYGGFDYDQYLSQKDILGTIEVEELMLKDSKESSTTSQLKIANWYASIENLKEEIYSILPENTANIFIAMILGDKSKIDNKTIEDFRNSNLSHILAVSGMHMTLLIYVFSLLVKSFIGKRKTYLLSIILIIFYMAITGFSASIVRAGIMGIIMLIAKIIYRKNDIWTAISISLFIMLVYHPLLIFDLGLQLSYGGTVGILLFQKNIFKILKEKVYKIPYLKYHINRRKVLRIKKILEILSVSISAQFIILPITIKQFHTLSLYFIISNLLVSFMIEPLFIISIVFLVFVIICKPIAIFLELVVKIIYQTLIYISYLGRLPYAKILITKPSTLDVLIYFLISMIWLISNQLKTNKLRKITYRRFKNIKAWILYKIKGKRKILTGILLIFFILNQYSYLIFPQKLYLHFVDVGQGDCTFIITPRKKKILIDGGGSSSRNFEVGKNIVIPYLLNRGVKKLDMIIISHFDQDHVGRPAKCYGRIESG